MGSHTASTRITGSAATPPMKNTECQPNCSILHEAMNPPDAAPRLYATNISPIIVARILCGMYSAASAMPVGMAPPRPMPARKRNANSSNGDEAMPAAKVKTLKIVAPAMMMFLRPSRSP